MHLSFICAILAPWGREPPREDKVTKRAIRITTAGEVSELDLSMDSLTVLQNGVGGWVEAVDLARDLTLWCNEEGKMNGLPHNPFAQFMWDRVFGAHTDYIVGDIVLTGGADDEGYTLGLTDEQAGIIRNIVAEVRGFVEPGFKVTAG